MWRWTNGAAQRSCCASTTGSSRQASRQSSPEPMATSTTASREPRTPLTRSTSCRISPTRRWSRTTPCAAWAKTGILEVWAGTESPVYTQMTGARIAGIDQGRVRVHVPDAGGSFGLHYSSGQNDPAAEALQIAKALDWRYPIKVQCSREEEFKSGRFRAMAVHRVRAGVNADGRVTAYHQQMAAEPTSPNLPFVGDVLFKVCGESCSGIIPARCARWTSRPNVPG